ncbi:hypothetical protein HRG_012655 [Hirsutella rhossiliensis]
MGRREVGQMLKHALLISCVTSWLRAGCAVPTVLRKIFAQSCKSAKLSNPTGFRFGKLAQRAHKSSPQALPAPGLAIMAGSQQPHIDANLQDASGGANLASTVIEALRQCLTEEQTTDKAPPGFDRALEALSPSDHTSRAFLDAGFGVWYAYFLATERNQFLKDSAAQLSPSNLRHVVAEVSRNAFTTSSFVLTVALNVASNYPLHRRHRPPIQIHVLPNQQSLSREPDSTETYRSQFMNTDVMTQEDEGSDSHPGRGRAQPDTVLASQNKACEWMAFDIDSRYQHAWPKAKNLPFVFSHYICTAVTKRTDEASVMLSFPSDPTDCRLVFDISAKEVQYVAKEVFDIHIREENGRRRVVSEKGATMDINSSITLRGGIAVALDSIFGQMSATYNRAFNGRLNFIVEAQNLTLLYQQLWRA